ncbi:MAG: hypothetical protein DMD85_02175 [Candidatus Rokuibacteriota bacterium]|nr:MAG: hypothetical protein DMD85_02175 [Candidatus Rokubacteria bacterium]
MPRNGFSALRAVLATLRKHTWAPAVLAADRGVAVICGVLGLWSLRSEWFRHTSVPLDAVLVGGVAAYILRLLFLGQRSTSFQTCGRV